MAAAHQESTTPEERSSASPTATTARRPGRATAALVLGIISIPAAIFAILGLIVGIVAIVLGATARADIRRNHLLGEGQAFAGLILGAIGVILSIANMVAAVAAL